MTLKSVKPRITGTVRFIGLEDPVMLNQLMEECRIELCHRETGDVLEYARLSNAASKDLTFHFHATTDGPCAIRFPREVRCPGVIARLQHEQSLRLPSIPDERIFIMSFETLGAEPHTLERVDYRVLPGKIKWQIFDQEGNPIQIPAAKINICSDAGKITVPTASITYNANNWYEASVAPGAYTLVVPDPSSDSSGTPYRLKSAQREQSFYVESERTHVTCATYEPLATTGTIRLQMIDQEGIPIANGPAISLLRDGTSVASLTPDACGWYELKGALPGDNYILILLASFPAPDGSTYRLQSAQRARIFAVTAGGIVTLEPALYQRSATLAWTVTVHGDPAPGLFVRVQDSATGQLLGDAVSGFDGTAQIPLILATSTQSVDVLVYRSGSPDGTATAHRIPVAEIIASASSGTAPVPSSAAGAAPASAPSIVTSNGGVRGDAAASAVAATQPEPTARLDTEAVVRTQTMTRV